MSFWGFFFFIFNYWLSFFFIVIISLPDGISRAFSSLLSTCLPTDIVEFYVLCATPLLVSPLFALCSSYHFPRDQVSMLTPGGEFDEQSKARRPLPCSAESFAPLGQLCRSGGPRVRRWSAFCFYAYINRPISDCGFLLPLPLSLSALDLCRRWTPAMLRLRRRRLGTRNPQSAIRGP
jgi:hypothetical protein